MTDYLTLDIKKIELPEGSDYWQGRQPGDMWKWGEDWMIACPCCGHIGTLRQGIHKITENADGTVTVEPSVLFESSKGVAHYFIRNSKVIPA